MTPRSMRGLEQPGLPEALGPVEAHGVHPGLEFGQRMVTAKPQIQPQRLENWYWPESFALRDRHACR